jgi:hypothetical protein
MTQRTVAMINGALITASLLGILDNIIVHWTLELHRLVPWPNVLQLEIALVVISAGLFILGIWRERQARRASKRK